MRKPRKPSSQLLPIFLTFLTFFLLIGVLFLFLTLLNRLPAPGKIELVLFPTAILIGFTIYVKTSVDFALFLGNLMHTYPGVSNRIAIELGSAIGNGLGTFLVIAIWILFKNIPLLLAGMVFISSLVLLRLAEESLLDFMTTRSAFATHKAVSTTTVILRKINSKNVLLEKLFPKKQTNQTPARSFLSLFIFSLSIPFLLGLDNFAGYITLFSLVNIFGFATGVFLGHMALTASLFAAPGKTTHFVRQPVILLLGSVVFLGLSLWGFIEVGKVLLAVVRL